MRKVLEEIFDEERELFPPDVKTKENLVENYHCFRLFRRASNTRVTEKKVSITDIETVNHWGKEERARHNTKLSMFMRQHYAQPELLIEPFWQYTNAM